MKPNILKRISATEIEEWMEAKRETIILEDDEEVTNLEVTVADYQPKGYWTMLTRNECAACVNAPISNVIAEMNDAIIKRRVAKTVPKKARIAELKKELAELEGEQ